MSSHLAEPQLVPDAARIFYLTTAVSSLCFALSFTLSVVYLATTVGLSIFQLVLVGTVLELTCFVLEVPTGVVADRFSRRLSILIGLTLIGFGLLLQGAVPAFGPIILAQVLWGAGTTFTSGATEAWIVDEIGDQPLRGVFTRAQQWRLGASIVGICGAGALAMINIQVPLICSGTGFLVLAALLCRIMPERRFQSGSSPGRQGIRQYVATARVAVAVARRRPVVRAVLVVTVFVGLSREAFDRLWQLRLLQFPVPAWGGRPYVWITLVELGGVLVALGCSLAVNRVRADRHEPESPHRILAVLAGASVVGIVILALTPALWLGLAAVWLKAAATTLTAPLQTAWLNRGLESSTRATVLSFQSQAGALGEIAGGPPLAALGQRTSVSVALLGAAALLVPTVVIFALQRPRRGGEECRDDRRAGVGLVT